LPLGDLRDPELAVPAIAGAAKVRAGGNAISSLAAHLSGKQVLPSTGAYSSSSAVL